MADFLKPDLCIVGAGALGVNLAIKARQRGLDVVLVDRGEIEPGDPARGNLLRATLAASAERAHLIRSAAEVGLGASEPKLNFRAISDHAAAVAAAAAPRDSIERLNALGIGTHSGNAAFIDRQTLGVGDALIRARRFVLATGARPRVPPIPGLDAVPYFTPDSIYDNSRKLTHLAVIGGGATALELAQTYRRLGAAVTIVPNGALLPGFDAELAAILLRVLTEEGVQIIEGADVLEIQPRGQGTGVVVRNADGSEQGLDVSHILLAMDRVPDLDAGLLDKARLRRDQDRPDHLLLGTDGQTSNPRLLAIGGAAGEHRPRAAARQADRVLVRLLGETSHRARHAGPDEVATRPALAQVGMVEKIKPLRAGQLILRANLAENDAARASGRPHGAIKLIVGRNGAILGGAALGPGAIDIVAMLAIAMERGMTAVDLCDLALPESSPLSALVDLAVQYRAQQSLTGWARRRAALRKLLP